MTFFAFRIYRLSVNTENDSKFYDYRILVCGAEKHDEFMADFYSGAKFVATAYNGITEYIDIDHSYEEFSLEKCLDYARFSDADGLIIFSDDESFFAKKIQNVHGKEIPVVVAGECKDEGHQVSRIEVDLDELEKLVAEKIKKGGWKKTAAFVRQPENHASLVTKIIPGIEKKLEGLQKIQMFSIAAEEMADDDIRSILMALAKDNSAGLILCFSEEDTDLTVQTIIEQNLTDKFSVMGFFKSSKNVEFLKKGIISAIIYMDPWEVGAAGVSELFAWKKNGFTNGCRLITPKIIEGGAE